MKISNHWFYSDPPRFLRVFLIYIKGDALVLIPFIFILASFGFFSLRFMVISFAVYMVMRYVGEMVYWLLQQFLGGTYRPFDYGLKHLDNNAIYILYQLTCLCWATLGSILVIYLLFF